MQIIHKIATDYEGEYSNSKLDAGGETRWGVTRKLYENVRPDGDFDNAGLNEMEGVLKEVFWNPHFDSLNPALQFMFVDTMIHHGQGKATRMIQSALKVERDGIFGRNTAKAARECDVQEVILDILIQRNKRIQGHPWAFGLGNRLFKVQRDSLKLYYGNSNNGTKSESVRIGTQRVEDDNEVRIQNAE